MGGRRHRRARSEELTGLGLGDFGGGFIVLAWVPSGSSSSLAGYLSDSCLEGEKNGARRGQCLLVWWFRHAVVLCSGMIRKGLIFVLIIVVTAWPFLMSASYEVVYVQ